MGALNRPLPARRSARFAGIASVLHAQGGKGKDPRLGEPRVQREGRGREAEVVCAPVNSQTRGRGRCSSRAEKTSRAQDQGEPESRGSAVEIQGDEPCQSDGQHRRAACGRCEPDNTTNLIPLGKQCGRAHSSGCLRLESAPYQDLECFFSSSSRSFWNFSGTGSATASSNMALSSRPMCSLSSAVSADFAGPFGAAGC